MKSLILCFGLAASVLSPVVFAQAVPIEKLDKIVAIVDEDVILQSELDRAVSNVLAQAQAQNNGQLPPRDIIEKQVLERLILTRVQVERAGSTGIQVGDAEIDQSVARIAAQNKLTLEQLRTSLERDGFSFDEFRKSMRDELTIQRFRQRYAQSRVQITDTEIDILLASDSLKTGQVRLEHILVGVSDGATPLDVQTAREKAERVVREVSAGTLSFAQAAIKYSEGQQALEGGDLGWRRYEEVPTVFSDLVAGMKKGDVSQPIRGPNGFHIIRFADEREDTSAKAIKEFKARHILISPSELQTEEQSIARIAKLREQALAGGDFAELARKYSQDDNTANLGGDMNWFVAGEYGARVTEVVESLKDGEISEPFRTEVGWHILKREDSRERDRTEEYLRGQARDAIMRRKAEEEFENYLRQIKAEAYIENRLAG
jgi:peptidyl-prolyl cis-trans isomerase SurA